MAKNKNLNAAARVNKDEFYTQLTDIEQELQHYWEHFADKVVFCNCDDPFESQFFFYFAMKSKHYPRYDNYDAIEVSKTSDIPEDYFGVMGVPITFLDKYCPDQFEIVGRADANIASENKPYHIGGFKDKGGAPLINGKFVYKRILIRRRR